jgi:ribonuclease HII
MDQSGIVKPPTFRTERSLAGRDCKLIAGVDEAGRGPWAGPVVAAAVVFANGKAPRGLNDSKLLAPEVRAELCEAILATAWVGIGIVSVEEIDRLNILQATFRAMIKAVSALCEAPEVVLVDGNLCPKLPHRAVPVVSGDQLCPSISAASIVAKVTRDRLMENLSQDFPGYSWHTNKGYGTPEHARAIDTIGITEHHRRSFAPIRLAMTRTAIAGAELS